MNIQRKEKKDSLFDFQGKTFDSSDIFILNRIGQLYSSCFRENHIYILQLKSHKDLPRRLYDQREFVE